MGEGEFHTLAIEDGIATITLNRAERLNALHPAAHHELSDLFDRLPGIPGIRVAIITGSGDRAFCAGYDLRDSLETGIVEVAPTGFGGLTSRIDYPIPLIAAVNGVALGGGFELALACDIIVAAETASFALPEPKVGLAALAGGVQRLPRAIGTKRALDIILTARTVPAAEGLMLGFVNAVVPASELMVAARQRAAMIAANGPIAVRCSKQIAYASLDQPDLASALDIDNYSTARAMLASEDVEEGRRAFVERRKPEWRGR